MRRAHGACAIVEQPDMLLDAREAVNLGPVRGALLCSLHLPSAYHLRALAARVDRVALAVRQRQHQRPRQAGRSRAPSAHLLWRQRRAVANSLAKIVVRGE